MNIEMHRCGVIITYRCNLKCELCAAYSPYYDVPPHFTLDQINSYVDKYFSFVDYVKKFTLSGGEPMLHKHLAEILENVFKYADKIGFVEIITNGTVLPNEKILKAILSVDREKIKFLIDDYGKNLSTKVEALVSILSQNTIPHIVRNNNCDAHCGGWIDFGDFSTRLFEGQDVPKQFEKCAIPQKMHFCYTIKHGEIHPCGPSYRCMELGVIPRNDEEFIDLFSEGMTKAAFEMKLKKLQSIKKLEACGYCKGMCDDSVRYTPAVQLK